MRLLLDTHIFLWSLLEPSKLGSRVATELQDPDNEIWVSPVTTWECVLLAEGGRVVLEPDPVSWIRKQLRVLRPKEPPLNHEVAIQSCVIDLPHRDPADRFLAATAMVFDLTLVTGDERLLRSKGFAVMPNL